LTIPPPPSESPRGLPLRLVNSRMLHAGRTFCAIAATIGDVVGRPSLGCCPFHRSPLFAEGGRAPGITALSRVLGTPWIPNTREWNATRSMPTAPS
jgi:hypothetical protein